VQSISHFLTHDHRSCDETLAQLEDQIAQEQWDDALMGYLAFRKAMEHHFNMEEKVLFPEFETRTGMAGGPTHVMRMEHQQMRTVIGDLGQSVNNKDKEKFFGISETLMMLIQQHNAKEEQMLYRMADQVFGTEGSALVEQLQAMES